MKYLVTIILIGLIAVQCNSTGENIDPDGSKVELLNSLQNKVQQYPDSASIRMLYVNALDSLQMYNQALEQLDSLIAHDSLNNGLWFAKGALYESAADTTSAINSYEKAISIYPSVEAQLSLANLFAEKSNMKALAICQNVSQMGLGRETDAACDFIAGVYHARKGDNAKAIAFFDRAINNNYTLMEAYMEKGFIYYGLQDNQQALKTFETAITVQNTYADAYYWKAKTYEKMGNKDEALLNYERSLGLDKQLTEARDAIERLN